MLEFFRKYQRYFFLVITVVIIISFSFFGTYSTLGSNSWREQVAFTAINGKEILSTDVDEMALFLSTDSHDKLYFGEMWGPNFLNDGVIRNDFLKSGLAQELASAYPEEIQEDIDIKSAKEKHFTPYSHPQAPFINVTNVWTFFAPQMNDYYQTMTSAKNGLDPAAFDSRIKLYLAEKNIPASTLRQILRYQEKQYEWLTPDERLNQSDLSLFGYHTLEDWFGPRFTRLVSEFIINTAIVAEEQGYSVTKAEVLTDLVRNTQTSYQQNLNNPQMGVTSPEQYLNEQLRRMNMDQARAIKIWRQVLLFRRYFEDAGSNAIVDTLASQKLHQFAKENSTIDLYRLPPELRVANYDDLQKLEAYLTAAVKQNKSDPLAIPAQYLPVAEVAKKYPELVQKRYVLLVAKVDLNSLQSRIGLRDLWNWEADETNWNVLAKQFPVLAAKLAKNREERFEFLDSLDTAVRSSVDAFAKKTIISAHPEWIEQSLASAKPEKVIIGLRSQGGRMPISGLDDQTKRVEFIHLLDEAPISEQVSEDSPLYDFSADSKVYYRIAVLDRADSPEILAYQDAKADGTLSTIRDRLLEQYYAANRGKDATLYQNEKKEWKPFKDVQEAVADQYYHKTLQSLEKVHQDTFGKENGKKPSKNETASLRLYPFVSMVKEKLEKGGAANDQWVKVIPENGEEKEGENKPLPPKTAIADQWKLEKTTVTISRHEPGEGVDDVSEALTLNENAWSSINKPVSGDLAFYQKKERKESSFDIADIGDEVREIQHLLGAEAQRNLMKQVLAELKKKGAISLSYLKAPVESPFQEELQPGDLGE